MTKNDVISQMLAQIRLPHVSDDQRDDVIAKFKHVLCLSFCEAGTVPELDMLQSRLDAHGIHEVSARELLDYWQTQLAGRQQG